MDSIEKAIRNALAKGDPGNRAFREKVYRSAFGALDRSIAASPNITDAIAQRRRQTLLAAITAIETEFVPAKATSEAQQPDVPLPPLPSSSPAPAPSVTAPSVAVPQQAEQEAAIIAPVLDTERSPLVAGHPGRAQNKRGKDARLQRKGMFARQKPEGKRRKGRRQGWRFGGLFASLLLVAGLIMLWWLAALPGGPAAPSRNSENIASRLPGAAAATEGWIDIFIPADPTNIAATGDAQAEVMEGDDGQFLRIRSGASGAPVQFDIGQGVLAEIAGRRAVFSLAARGADGQSTQVAVDCSLAELGDCGRKRYDAGASREEFLFEIELPAARVTSGGTVSINPDLENSGKPLDIYAIRVLPGQ